MRSKYLRHCSLKTFIRQGMQAMNRVFSIKKLRVVIENAVTFQVIYSQWSILHIQNGVLN